MGPLKGVKIVEVGGIGPVPFCGQLLSDMGADIIRIERQGELRELPPKFDVLLRGRSSMCIDLKKPEGIEIFFRLIDRADGLIEGFRPGVMERLGIGPDKCLKRNQRLVYGRMTGWGQEGPLAQAAGHDINYIALTGALHAIGRTNENPIPPLNLVGDQGGGGMFLAFGVLCALFEARDSGQGQVVDVAIVDGVAALMGYYYGAWAAGEWIDQREMNYLDGGSHFYSTYETADGKWICIGAIEPKFYTLLLELIGAEDSEFENQMDTSKWPLFKTKIAKIFKSKTRDEWCEIMEGTDVCFAPVLSIEETMKHPHNISRGTFIEMDGIKQPVPVPRFSRTQPQIQGPASEPGENTESILHELGYDTKQIKFFRELKVI